MIIIIKYLLLKSLWIIQHNFNTTILIQRVFSQHLNNGQFSHLLVEVFFGLD